MSDREPLPLGYGLAVMWAVMAALVLGQLLQAFVTLRPGVATDVVTLGALEALVFVFGMWALLKIHGTERALSHQLALRPTHFGFGLVGLLLGLSLHFPAESLRQLVELRFPTPSEELAQRAALLDGSTPLRAGMVLAVVGCIGPLVEELFFRGALYGLLRRSHAVVGSTVVTAAAFVVTHLDPRLWAPLLVVSAVLGFLRAASGSLLPGLALHVAFNTVTVIAVASGVSSAESPQEMDPTVLVPGWIATAILLLGAARLGATDDAAEARSLDGT